MGKISLSDERSGKADVLAGLSVDHSLVKVFFRFRNLLIISIVLLLAKPQIANSQISNELVFDSMLIGFCQEKADKLSKVTGFLTSGLEDNLKNKLKGSDSMEVEAPRIKYSKVGDDIERLLEIDLILSRETGEMEKLSFRDTLDRKSLRKVRSTKYPELKGEHPSTFRRYILPSIGLAAGVGSIVSLFYIRSR